MNDFQSYKKAIQATLPLDAQCPYCNVIMERADPSHSAYITIDHIIPFSICKNNNPKNLLAVCHNCNMLKENKEVFEVFTLKRPIKISSKEIRSITAIMQKEPTLLILEEIRILLILGDYKSFKEYKKHIKDEPGSRDIVKLIGQLWHIKYNVKELTRLDRASKSLGYDISQMNLDDVIMAIIEKELSKTNNIISEAKITTRNIPFYFRKINIAQLLEVA